MPPVGIGRARRSAGCHQARPVRPLARTNSLHCSAHELQHALEVADAPEIKDLASFQKAFDGRGWKGAHGFETAQAREVTKRVTAELGSTSEAANRQEREWAPSSKSRKRIIAVLSSTAKSTPERWRLPSKCCRAGQSGSSFWTLRSGRRLRKGNRVSWTASCYAAAA